MKTQNKPNRTMNTITKSDNFGAKYSDDGKTLISIPNDLVFYKIKEGTECIADSACIYCSLLFAIYIPHTVKEIGEGAFKGCTTLRSVCLPDGITEIPKNAFCDCQSLSYIRIPKSVTDVGIYAFSGCISLMHISTNPSNGWVLERQLPSELHFALCEEERNDFIQQAHNGINVREACQEYEGTDTITREDGIFSADGKTLVRGPKKMKQEIAEGTERIACRAFLCHRTLRTAILPHSIKRIDTGAFYNCYSLQKINLPSQLEEIGIGAFVRCNKLKSIAIPPKITHLKEALFFGCVMLQDVALPDSLLSIGNYAFKLCLSLRQIVLPPHVESIGCCAFAKCDSLEMVSLSDSLQRIGHSAFAFCKQLKKIILPASTMLVGEAAFFGCENLEVVDLSQATDDKLQIERLAFHKCERLKTILVADSMQAKRITAMLPTEMMGSIKVKNEE